MRPWRLFLFAALALGSALFALPGVGSAANDDPFNIASESYFRLDVEKGTISAEVDARIQSSNGKEVAEIWLWAMPRAQDVKVFQGDSALEIESTAISDQLGLPTLITAKLAKPLKNKLIADLRMTYVVPPQSTDYVKIEPGAIEALMVSQGQGSFVLIDVPAASDNFVEPGCFKATDQPVALAEQGFIRFVCGETLAAAIFNDHDDVRLRCAAMSDSCRQRNDPSPFTGFAQSITDPAKQGRLEATIPMAGGDKSLTLLYFRTDEEWARREFEIARSALPLLEAAFGFPYPHDSIVLRESTLISMAGAAGIAFTEDGEMLLNRTDIPGRFDEGVAVHELAHQWAGLNLDAPWEWEGLAEWGRMVVAPSFGLPVLDRPVAFSDFGYTDPLATWRVSSSVTHPDYWYGKAGAFWIEYEKSVGGRANMTAVLGQIDDAAAAGKKVDGKWFQDRGEEVSGANLDELFLSWVYVRETASPLLAERRAAHDLVNQLRERARTLALNGLPTDLQANLDAWTFDPVQGQVERANRLLDEYTALLARAAQQGGVGTGISGRWNKVPLIDIESLLTQMSQALDAMEVSAARLSNGVDDPSGRESLDQARIKFLSGDFAEAKRLAAGATSIGFNKEASAKIIALAKERKRTFSPGFFQTIGMYFEDPAGQITAAESAYDDGDFAKALELANGAIVTWDESQQRGLFRLSVAAGLMTALALGCWWLVRRLDGRRHPAAVASTGKGGLPREGHVLAEPSERAASWRDWMNQGDKK
ncbi:MAG: hypothetical protein R3B97_10770 [Dehalococcoidia bacterium]